MIRGIIDLIVDDVTASGLIGSVTRNGATKVKVYPVVAEPETAKPYVTIRRTGQATAIMKGQAQEVDTPVFSITAYADKYKTCIDILNAIRNVIDDYSGTSNGIVFKRAWYINSEDFFDKDDDAFVITDTYTARIQPA